MNERLARREVGAKHDAERVRRHDVILSILISEAAERRLYTMTQFMETFENLAGLGSKFAIRERLSVLTTKGFVKFLRDGTAFGYPVVRSRFGYLVAEGMEFPTGDAVDDATGEIRPALQPVLPSHFKCTQTGACLEVENPSVWVYPEGAEGNSSPH